MKNIEIIEIKDKAAYGKKYGRFFVTYADVNLTENYLIKGVNKLNQKWDFYDSLEEAEEAYYDYNHFDGGFNDCEVF